MEAKENMFINVRTDINAPMETVWKCWITPSDVMKWNYASNDWHTVSAVNDLHVGGRFKYRMEAKDGSFGFDFEGVYNTVILHELIEYTLADDRKVSNKFFKQANISIVTQTFQTETENTVEVQEQGWQNILDNFKRYVEQIK